MSLAGMDMVQQLPQLEAACERLYMAQSAQERAQVEALLGVFGQSTEYIGHLKYILDTSLSPYAQHMAATNLLKLATEHTLSPQVRAEMKAYFLSYLGSKGPTLQHFVVVQLVSLLCRTTKLGWFDHDSHRTVVDDCKALLDQGSSAHYLLALRILNAMVVEFNTPTPGRTLTQHRKAAVNFRDTVLLRIFQLSLTSLADMAAKGADLKMREQGLLLCSACMSFDFVGTCLDDSSEEPCTIQVPSTWRAAVEEPNTVQLLLDYYGSNTPPLSSTALECLVRLASVRRSLFSSDAERGRFLNRLVAGTRDIMGTKRGLAEHDNYHELCRLLGRLKTNYQLAELVAVEGYTGWIQLVAQLTIDSLNSWQWAQSSVYYLLGLWSRLVSSMPYLKGDQPSLLEANVPAITQAYITSRLESVQLVLGAAGGVDDMLDSEEALAEQLDALPYLVRFQYDKSAVYLASLFDPLLEAFSQARTASVPAVQLAVLEGQLTWLVYIVGALIKGRLSATASEAHETLDGDLAARVLQLLSFADEGFHLQRYSQVSRQRLDQAIIYFFQCFRKVYIGEQVMHSTKVYSRLSERLGLADHPALLAVILNKLAKNLTVYARHEPIVHSTLALFQDLAAGYMSGKLLIKLDACAFILQHHTAEYYAFLDVPANTRNRSTFYSTLARLLFMDEQPIRFKACVAPITQVLTAVAVACPPGTPAALMRSNVPLATMVGLFRDLRGIVTATNSRRTYALVFDWLYPVHFPAILKCLEAWADTPAVTTPLLKFMAEFVFNKSSRLTFDASSPSGILLFREMSKVLVTYGHHVLGPGAIATPAYELRYKGTWVCLLMLARAMSGAYVNFGVFDLYGDPALKDALDTALRLVLAVPLPDLLAFRKLSRAWFSLAEVLAHAHTGILVQQDLPTFSFLLTSCDAGLKSLDMAISSSCAAALDALAGFYFRNCIQGPESAPAPGSREVAEHVRAAPHLLTEALRSLFEIVLFEECSNQWSLSRPMLPLILISEQIYGDLKTQIIASQPPERQPHLAACLDKLMQEVNRNIEPKNRDKFTQNLTLCRHEYRSKA